MPRLTHKLLHRSHSIDPFLPLLLRTCRDLTSAQNELRWLSEHVASLDVPRLAATASSQRRPFAVEYGKRWRNYKLHKLCRSRARGIPLQYLLGTEHFAELELLVQRGVLIPRRETATAVSHLSSLLNAHDGLIRTFLEREAAEQQPEKASRIKVLDLCTGSGCIPLLLRHQLRKIQLDSLGVDISPRSVALAIKNETRTAGPTRGGTCRFERADIASDVASDTILEPADHCKSDFMRAIGIHRMQDAHIITSNPPYVSPLEYVHQTERSVRNYEPRLALVPVNRYDDGTQVRNARKSQTKEHDQQQADAFYPQLLHIASNIIRPKIFWCEVGGLEQAKRVAALALGKGHSWDGVQIWRDEPSQAFVESIMVKGKLVEIVGQGHGRSVICWREEGASWLGK